jgi:hypothetical protein
MSAFAWLTILVGLILSAAALLIFRDTLRRVAALLLIWSVGIPAIYLLNYYTLHALLLGRLIRLTDAFGVSPMLAYALAAPLVVIISYTLNLLASSNSQTRFVAALTLAGGVSLWWLALWTGTRDHMMGEFAKCYSIHEDGVHYFETQQMDPRTGAMCRWVKAEDIVPLRKLDQRLRSGVPMKRITFRTLDEVAFFYPNTNSLVPKIWYYANPNGALEFFDLPGYHPAYGERLKQMTPETARAWIRKFKEPVPIGAGSSDPPPSMQPIDPPILKLPRKNKTQNRYVGGDGCLREPDGSIALGFSARCDERE